MIVPITFSICCNQVLNLLVISKIPFQYLHTSDVSSHFLENSLNAAISGIILAAIFLNDLMFQSNSLNTLVPPQRRAGPFPSKMFVILKFELRYLKFETFQVTRHSEFLLLVTLMFLVHKPLYILIYHLTQIL